MVSKHCSELIFIFWLQQHINSSFWQFVECFIGRSEYSERTCAFECFYKTSSFYSSHECSVFFRIHCIFYDVFSRIHSCTTYHYCFLSKAARCVSRQHGQRHNRDQ